jgi:hypothetical protein
MDLQALIASATLVGVSVLIGAIGRDILFTWRAKAWTDRWFGDNDYDDDENWTAELGTMTAQNVRPALAWRALQRGARISRPGPDNGPGTAVAIREPRHALPSVPLPPPAPHRHRKPRAAPAYLSWLDDIDSRLADLDRRTGALS